MLYEHMEAGPDGTNIIIQVSTIVTLPHEEDVRLKHQMELSASGMLRRYNTHVAQWGAKKVALAKLTEGEADLLGVGRDWRAAKFTASRRKPSEPSAA